MLTQTHATLIDTLDRLMGKGLVIEYCDREARQELTMPDGTPYISYYPPPLIDAVALRGMLLSSDPLNSSWPN